MTKPNNNKPILSAEFSTDSKSSPPGPGLRDIPLLTFEALKFLGVVERSHDESFERTLEASVMVTEVNRKVR